MSEDAAKEVSLDWRTRWTRIIDKIHLLYLGLLPCLATVAVLRAYGFPLPFLLFIFGVAGVGIYLAVTWSYTPVPSSPLVGLWMVLDGPLFVLLGGRGEPAVPLGFAVEAFFVDGLAIWSAILFLAVVSRAPTPGQRVASIAILIAVLAVLRTLFWPYVRDAIWRRWLLLAGIFAGLAEGTFVRVRMLDAGTVVRETGDQDIVYIAGLVMLWVASMIAGMALYRAG
jgi:nitric oxide reductase large subunit